MCSSDLFTESIAEFQEQASQPFAGRLERKLIQVVHIDPDFIAEQLDQLDRQLRISLDHREVALLVDETDLRRFQRLAGYFMKRSVADDVFLDQLPGPQDPNDLPLASR